MAQKSNRLSDAFIRSKSLKPGLYHDGDGLYLQVKNGGRSWVLRYTINNTRRYMGLGRQSKISLAKARATAKECHALIAAGIDPIEKRRESITNARVEAAKSVTFEAAAQRFIKSKKLEWRNEKHAAQWEATLSTYAYPVIGKLPVQSIDTGLVLKVLESIWTEKTETATRVRQRIESILDWATAHKHRDGDNPARWRGHLDKLLPKPTKIRKVKHFEPLPFEEMPEFFADLKQRDTVSARALAFTILTAARSGETRFAAYEEIDFKKAIWTIPGDRTKSGREHRVPLTAEALALLRRDGSGLIFANESGEPLSDATMLKYLQENMQRPTLTVHGFRSTFRDWAAERTQVAGEIAEAALGHVTGDRTEQAYRRGDVLERRRRLMAMWSGYCASGAPSVGKIVSLAG